MGAEAVEVAAEDRRTRCMFELRESSGVLERTGLAAEGRGVADPESFHGLDGLANLPPDRGRPVRIDVPTSTA